MEIVLIVLHSVSACRERMQNGRVMRCICPGSLRCRTLWAAAVIWSLESSPG